MRFYFVFLLLLSSCTTQTVHPTRGEIVEAVYGLGTVRSDQEFHAKAAIVTSIDELYVTEGEDVVRGQKLFKTDQGSITSSPFDGRVTDIPISLKENLFPQSNILTVINLKKLFLSVSLEQQGAMRVKPGLVAEVSFEFFRNKKIRGKITTIYPSGDQFIAKVALDEWPSGVLPGMTADVAFEVDRKTNAILIPVRSVVNGHVHLKREGKKLKLPVQLGLVDQEKAEVVSPAIEITDEIIIP